MGQGIWRISKRDIEYKRSFDHRFFMGKKIKGMFSVIASKAGISNTAKRHSFIGDMKDAIVDHTPSKGIILEHSFLEAFLF